ncbi:hypothetical protein FWK35_00031857 [Aphis craccivora]|uniref:Uncharacterized protein n=1 Tax=Aphis craccivora TaxID=307492 RepID=A0A6G0ZEG8_APHCR|nr:hypothetical protein FWK35_00031857 [Aphis craccivora]
MRPERSSTWVKWFLKISSDNPDISPEKNHQSDAKSNINPAPNKMEFSQVILENGNTTNNMFHL